MTSSVELLRLSGQEIIPFLPDIAKLRISVFKEFPYLYDGNYEYEYRYLNTYVRCQASIMLLVKDGSNIVGASSALPLLFETTEFKEPFLKNNINIKDVFYFGESMLLQQYRGRHLYQYFFKEREQAARNYGCKIASFAAVERPINDSRKPIDYTPLDKVWKHFGYEKKPQLCTYFLWKDIGESVQTEKPLIFWLKSL